MGPGLILLWILPIGSAFANETPLTGHLLNLYLKENLTNIILHMKEAVTNRYTEKNMVEYFANQLKALEEDSSYNLLQKSYYKKMLEESRALLHYLQVNSYSKCDIFPCLSEETTLLRMKEISQQLIQITDRRHNTSDEKMEDQLWSIREASELFDAVVDDDNMSQEQQKLSDEVQNYTRTLLEYYKDNERITKILTAAEPRASKNAYKGRHLTKEESSNFFQNFNQVAGKLTADINGVYIIYVDGKCEMYSYRVDEFLTIFRCNFNK